MVLVEVLWCLSEDNIKSLNKSVQMSWKLYIFKFRLIKRIIIFSVVICYQVVDLRSPLVQVLDVELLLGVEATPAPQYDLLELGLAQPGVIFGQVVWALLQKLKNVRILLSRPTNFWPDGNKLHSFIQNLFRTETMHGNN